MARRTNRKINITNMVIIAIAIYVIVLAMIYFLSSSSDSYEVTHGKLEDYDITTGIAVRDETDIKAEDTLKPVFYVNEGDKINAGGIVYSTEGYNNESALDIKELSSNTRNQILEDLENIQKNHEKSNFYLTKQRLDDINKNFYTDDIIQYANPGNSFTSPRDGVISFCVDNMDGIKVDDVNEKNFDESNYQVTNTQIKPIIKTKDTIFKLVSSEDWHIIIRLDEDRYNKIKSQDKTKVSLQFLSDGFVTNAGIKPVYKDSEYYGILSLSNSMVRYISDRFIEIKVIYDGATGLKIPKSAIFSKQFHMIPNEYITGNGISNNDFIYKKTSKSNKYVPIEIYYVDYESGYTYLTSDEIKNGDIIYNKKKNVKYTVHKTGILKGVYCVNKGYSQFKRIDILFDDGEYAVVAEGSQYGLSNYDLVATDHQKAKRDEL